MFYFYHGEDQEKSRNKARETLEAMKKKRQGAEVFRVTTESFDKNVFEEYLSGQGLFERKFIVFGDGLFGKVEAKEFILESLDKIASSENGFVFLESRVDAASLKKIEKHSIKTEKFEKKSPNNFMAVNGKSFSTAEFNIFGLGDLLGRRDKKGLWVLYREALSRDIPPEEINGILFWQVKSMILAKDSESPAKSGLSPFVHSKSKKYALNFQSGELEKLSEKLVSIYHEARRGNCDFEAALEKLILEI